MMLLVTQSQELHHRLEYVNQHQKCEINQLQNQVDTCHQELVYLRAHSHGDTITKTDNKNVVKLRSMEHELKMVNYLILIGLLG